MLSTKLRLAQSARFDNKKRLPTSATRPEALAAAHPMTHGAASKSWRKAIPTSARSEALLVEI